LNDRQLCELAHHTGDWQMKWLIVATAGSGLWLAALPTNASASEPLEQIYKSCRGELRGIGTGKGAPQRRFNMIEFCVSRKLAGL
jgi:hypothetical protein